MNQAFHLFRLQAIDTQIDQIAASLAEINRLLANDELVLQASKLVDEIEKTLHQRRQNLKQSEYAVHEQQMKIGQSEAALYAGRIYNPKELQDLQKEIASLKKHLAVLEDQQLESMLAVEEAETQEQSAQKELLQARAALAEKSAGWLGQKDLLTRTMERLQAERSAALSLVTPDGLQTYENMRKRKSGVAVTTIKDGSCSVCGATIRPSELQAARAAQNMVYCATCGRILYSG